MGASIEERLSKMVSHIFAASSDALLQKVDGKRLARFKGVSSVFLLKRSLILITNVYSYVDSDIDEHGAIVCEWSLKFEVAFLEVYISKTCIPLWGSFNFMNWADFCTFLEGSLVPVAGRQLKFRGEGVRGFVQCKSEFR